MRWAIFGLLAASVSLSSCASDPKKTLKQQTGILLCPVADVKELPSEHGDVFQFEVSAGRGVCNPPIATSIVEASKGGCQGLINEKGACAYSFQNRTVAAEREGVNPERYHIRSWQ